MATQQIKYGLGNTASGNMNKKVQGAKQKQIDLQGLDIQMMSTQFLLSKTLKKPLKQYGIQYQNTSQNYMKAQTDKTQKNGIGSNFVFQPIKSMEDFSNNLQKTQKIDYTFISLNQNNKIKPAYKPVKDEDITRHTDLTSTFQYTLDNKNSIFSAMSKKGSKPKKSITFSDVQQKKNNSHPVQVQKNVGKAETKLKQLFNKNVTKPSSFGHTENKKAEKQFHKRNDEIQQEIQQSIINEYGEQEFQKYSQQSGAIKQSIREQLAASSGSGFIRQSIANSSGGKHNRSQIAEQIQQSIKGSKSASKDQIPQFINSFKSSGIRQEIQESLSGSRKSGQQVYQEIFQQYDDSLKNSRSGFKKSSSYRDNSDILSKSFRKKAGVVKSIKLAQQINQQNRLQQSEYAKVKKISDDKFQNQLIKQKNNLQKQKYNLKELLNKKETTNNISQKNKNLIYEFKIQINKLLTGQNFQSKLKRLTSFINFGQDQTKKSINKLEDQILKNIMGFIEKTQKPDKSVDQIQKMRQEYDNKLNVMLKDQQINLRVQMDRKLHQKDMELKKMIAELQQKFQGKSFSGANAKINNFVSNQQPFMNNVSGYQMDSDYSIDSDNVSWKADLWEVLPQYEKRKLYEKQTKQVTNFLTDIMMNELKQQSFNRDLDISFQFPDQFNTSNQKLSAFPSFNKGKVNQINQDSMMPKSAFNRKQFQQNISVNHSNQPKKQSIFPEFQRPKQQTYQKILNLDKKQNVNQYYKLEGQNIPQTTKKSIIQKQKIMKVLSKYKSTYLRKKNDAIRKILKTLKPKDSKKVPNQNLLSVIQQITLLGKDEIDQNDLLYVRAYQQELIWALINIINKNQNRKTQFIEEQMRKNYQRLVVLCQVKTAQNSEQVVCLNIYQENKSFQKLKNNINLMTFKSSPLQIATKQQAIQTVEKKYQKKLKDDLVQKIMSVLMGQFAKEFPARKK